MSTTQTLVLGAIAGFTIFLGLPVARMRNASPALRAFLNAAAIGVLVFLLWDILGHGVEPVEHALERAHDGEGSWLRFAGLASVFAACLTIGLVPLVYYDLWTARRRDTARFGPGAAAVEEFRPGGLTALSPAYRLAFFIALGIGLHNLSEGLAIGQAAGKDEVSLALLLIIGFGLHNATEGFGIVAPLAAERERPGWGFLLSMGLIAGGPTFLGTIIGHSFINDTVFIGFLALAAGSILYVVMELLNVARKLGFKEVLAWGLLAGLLVGFATDFVLEIAGG